MSRLPAPVAAALAALGGLVTSAVLLVGLLSLTASTTELHMRGVASAVVVLPAGLVVAAIGFYVARRVFATLHPPSFDPSEDGNP
ncbi:MAG: hypothetical protein KDE68_03290 [Rhodocyclaceae bacterium]|nr:hypothetical protein [Rhodocyclaceae bacterium]